MQTSDDITLLDTVMDEDVFNNGIFTYIKNSLTAVPDYMQDITVLNQDYYYRHSGSKNISCLVRHFLDDKGKLTNDGCYSLARIIINDYKTNWDKIYKALTVDYSPIENYDSNEDSTDTRTTTTDHTGTDGTTHTGTDTTAQTGEDTTTDGVTIGTTNSIKDGTEKTVNGIAGFNTQDEFSKDTSSTKTVNQVVQNDEKRNLTGSTKYGKTETNTLDTSDNTTYNSTIKETDSTTHTLHRHGNIGVTTSQNMIEAELVLRRKHFFDIVFSDLDRLLTLSIY